MTDNKALIEQIKTAKDPQEMHEMTKAAGYNNFNIPPQEVREAQQDKWDEWWSVDQFNLPGMNFTWQQQYQGLCRNARTMEHCLKINAAFRDRVMSLPKKERTEMIKMQNNRMRDIQMAERAGVRFDIAKALREEFERKQMYARMANKSK